MHCGQAQHLAKLVMSYAKYSAFTNQVNILAPRRAELRCDVLREQATQLVMSLIFAGGRSIAGA